MLNSNQSLTGGITKHIKGYRYRFYPTTEQIELLNNTFGCVRFVYNNLLDRSIKAYESYVVDNSLLKPFIQKNSEIQVASLHLRKLFGSYLL